MKPLGTYVEKFVIPLLQLWQTGAKDPNEECRNNAVYGLGEMILHGKNAVFVYPFSSILNPGIFLFYKENP